MNKNPFLPAPSFTPQQPPLPPGPPPPQPSQADYSAWWGGPGGHQHQPHAQPPAVGQYNPQWAPPQPPRPPADQSALYANYGYGTQNNHWQRQQQQQPPPPQYHPPPQVMQQPPAPPTSQPGYNPYQPATGYPQAYVPQPGPPPQPMVQAAYPYPQAQQQQQMFAPSMPPQQPQQHQHQQPTQPRNHHASPQHLPPAKRQRFDGPNANNRHHQSQQHHPPPPAPQFQPSSAPPQNPSNFSGPNRGPIPSGPGNRGGGPTGPSGRGGNAGGRGGRGGSMGGNRGGLGGGRGRGGSFVGGSGGRGGAGGGQPTGPSRGHGSRSNFGSGKDFHNRRGGAGGSGSGGGNYSQQGSSSFRGRNQGSMGSGRGNRNEAGSGNTLGSREGTSTASFGGKKDENRRTLTDFKIIGLAISDLGWTWGSIPSASPVKAENVVRTEDAPGNSEAVVKDEIVEDGKLIVSSSSLTEENSTEVALENAQVSQSHDMDMADSKQQETSRVHATSDADCASSPPPSRIRIYFHTPVTADDSRPIPHTSSYGDIPSDTRKGKRKKLEDDDGDLDERRAPPPPPQMGTINDDRSNGSVAPSVAETASEADWLMAAIVEGEEEAEAAGELEPGEEEEPNPLHVSRIANDEHHGHHDDDEDADAEGEDDMLLGGKQTHIDRDVALGVKDPPLYCLTGGGLSPRAHTADLFAFLQGISHNDDDDDMTGHAERDVLESSAAAGNLGQAITEPAGAPKTIAGNAGNVNGDSATHHSGAEVTTARPSAPEAHASISPHVNLASQNDSHASEFAADHSADHPEYPETQAYTESSQSYTPKSLLAVSVESTLLDIQTQEATQTDNSQMTQIFPTPIQPDHLPEPPASPVSNTLLSTSSTSAFEDASSSITKVDTKTGKTPSANRLSISYSRGNRRLVVDAEVVESLKLFRQEGRVEVVMKLNKEKDDSLKGIVTEGLSEITKSYLPLAAAPDGSSDSDPTVPPFTKVEVPSTLQLTVYLDTTRPLSEPKWAKTGDIQDWLKSMFGRMFWVAGDAAEGWEKKIHVVDPDPPPTIWTVLDGWATNSPVGALNERQRFLKTHMTETDNILEILLRLVRGERATAFSQSTPTISAPSVSGPLLSALSQGSAHGAQQTHVSLAVLAMFRLSVDYAKKALGDKGKADAEEHIGEIIRCLPSHLIYKSLDGIFKEWRVEKKGR